MQNKSMRLWWTGIIIVMVLAIVVGGWIIHNHQSSKLTSTTNQSLVPTTGATITPSLTPQATATQNNTGPTSEAYTKMVAAYISHRIQFDTKCEASPANVTYRNPVNIMLDNRSGDPAKIYVGTASYDLAAWGYKIVTVESSKLPATIYLSCDVQKNVATILLQK